MKKILLTLSISAFLFSCSSGPEKAAKNFTENIAKGKTEEAKKYATEATGKLIDFAASFGGGDIDPNFEFKAVKDSIVDNEAWVTYLTKEGKEETIKLVKIDGEWLVHMESKK